MELGVVTLAGQPLIVYCDNSRAVTKSKELKSQKHIQREIHMVIEIVQRGDAAITKINHADNLGDHFTKPLTTKVFAEYVNAMSMRCNPEWH